MVFSSNCACRRDLIRRVEALWTGLFTTFACYLVITLSGCGYEVNGSVAGPLRVSPSTISFGALPVGQTAIKKNNPP